MAIAKQTTIASNNLNIDNKIGVTVHDWASGDFFERSTAQDIYHVEAKVGHDTYGGIIKGGTSLFPFEGEISITWSVEASDVATVKSDLASWKALVSRSDITITEDWTANTVTATVNADFDHGSWVSHPFPYVPLSNTVRIDAGSNGAKIACIMRLADVNDWSVEYKTINSIETIAKSGTECYIFLSSDYSIGDTDYDAYTVSNLTSASVDVTPTGRCTVIKVYK